MSNDLITSKIELLQEQIDSLEKSGFYTEKDMDRLTNPIRIELQMLNAQLVFKKIGMSAEESGKAISNFGKVISDSEGYQFENVGK